MKFIKGLTLAATLVLATSVFANTENDNVSATVRIKPLINFI